MTEMKAQLLTELPYHRVFIEMKYFIYFSKLILLQIEQPRKPNKYVEFFGSYIALPLMTVVLVLSLLILFLLVKTYFSNSYMYAIQEDINLKNNNLNIGDLVDNRYDQFNNRPHGQIVKKTNESLLDKLASINDKKSYEKEHKSYK